MLFFTRLTVLCHIDVYAVRRVVVPVIATSAGSEPNAIDLSYKGVSEGSTGLSDVLDVSLADFLSLLTNG